MTAARIPNYNLARLYPIKGRDDVTGFVPGRTASGEQVLMGPIDKDLLVALFFAPDGTFLRYDFFPVPCSPDPALLPGQQELQQGYVLQDAKQRWMAGLGVTPGDIRVRHFAFPEWRIGIAEWPLAEYPEVAALAAAGQPLEDEFHIEWQEQGRYVLHWGREHWMIGDGDIGDT
jgi:hypothetical protein